MALQLFKPFQIRTLVLASTLLITGFTSPSATAAGSDLRIPTAAKEDNSTAVRALLQQKADVNAALDDGSTALHWAAANDEPGLVTLLLKAGANPGAATRVGALTPLALAAQNGDPAVVSALLKAGADPNAATSNGTTPLMFAAESGSSETVSLLLDHGAKIEAKESVYGQNALMFAAAKNRAGVIRILIRRGADPKIASNVSSLSRQRYDDDGNPIGGPAAGGAAGAGPVGAGSDDAAGSGAGRRGGRRRRGGAAAEDPTAPGAEGASATATATSAAAPAAPASAPAADKSAGAPAQAVGAERLASAPPTDGSQPGAGQARARGGGAGRGAGAAGGFAGGFGGRGPARSFGGNTPLTLAAREGNADAVAALVESGADINEGNANDKTTPIVTAITNGHYDVAKYLLDHGANPNQANTDGLAALYEVIDTQWAPVGWSPNPITDQEQITYLGLMKALIDKGADVNAHILRKLWFRPTHHDESWINAAGATPFWRAAQATDIAAMRLLADHGADVKAATNEGVNPLMVAAGLGWNGNYSTQGPDSSLATVKYCLELGIDPTAQSSQGYTAICGAAYRGDNELIKLLLAHGAKLDTRSARGWSVTDMANGPSLRSSVPVPHPETVALLLKLGAPPLTSTADEEILGVIRRSRVAATDADAPEDGSSDGSPKTPPPSAPASPKTPPANPNGTQPAPTGK